MYDTYLEVVAFSTLCMYVISIAVDSIDHESHYVLRDSADRSLATRCLSIEYVGIICEIVSLTMFQQIWYVRFIIL